MVHVDIQEKAFRVLGCPITNCWKMEKEATHKTKHRKHIKEGPEYVFVFEANKHDVSQQYRANIADFQI